MATPYLPRAPQPTMAPPPPSAGRRSPRRVEPRWMFLGAGVVLVLTGIVALALVQQRRRRAGPVVEPEPPAEPATTVEPAPDDSDGVVPTTPGAVRAVSQSELDALRSTGPCVVMYWARWCHFCKQLDPAYGAAAALLPALRFLSIEETQVADTEEVRTFPTVRFYAPATSSAKSKRPPAPATYAGPYATAPLAAWARQQALKVKA